MGIFSKIQTFVWFLKRPALYPQMIYLFYQRVSPHPKEGTMKLAMEWCKELEITSEEALLKITGVRENKPLSILFPDFFSEATDKLRNLPVKMGGGADLEILYYLAEYANATTVIETGVAHGWSSAALLLSLSSRSNSRLYSTDMPYPKMGNEEYVGCVVPVTLRANWELIRMPDKQAIVQIETKISSIDLCHYDSDKSYRGRMWAYPKLWSLLREGGIFISDDINDNIAFKEFAESVQQLPIVVYYKPEKKHIGILIKKSVPKK